MFISFKKRANQTTLWERYVQGDRAAFGELYAYYHKSLTAFCWGRLKNRELAENAASETLVRLLQHKAPGEIENFEHWLFTVAKNECHTVWSTAERRKKLLDANYMVMHEHSPEIDEVHSIENIDSIIKQNLDETDFNIWQLHQQGYDNGEIAEITGMQEKTIANRKSVARNKLKNVLQDFFSGKKHAL
jgi:RNA polymerase sigma factor (sigma-70 family)